MIVLNGVLPGEDVVTSAQFLIDSESKLREAAAKMTEAGTRGSKPDGSSPPDMEMDVSEETESDSDETR